MRNKKTIPKTSPWMDVVMILIGSAISAVGINMFIVHANLLSGGVSGISLILQYLWDIPAGASLVILNLPLFWLSYRRINRRFTLHTLLGTFSLAGFLLLTTPIRSVLSINDPLLFCIYGGVLNGIGFGIVFSHHGSTGGTDIISILVRQKYENFNVGSISFAVNLIIVSVAAYVFGLSSALYTLISMYISSVVTDKVINGLNRQKLVIIISLKERQIACAIKEQLRRGVTFLYGSGVFTKQDKRIVYSVVSQSQLPQLKQLVRDIDTHAFMSILDASEIEGHGFGKRIG